MDKNELVALYDLCFKDGAEYARFFVERAGSDIVSIQSNGKTVAMGVIAPKTARLFGTVTQIAYASGICTHPDFRKQGLCTALMNKMLNKMYEQNYPLCVLNPFSPVFYHKYGFVDTAFCRDVTLCGETEYEVCDCKNASELSTICSRAYKDYDNCLMPNIPALLAEAQASGAQVKLIKDNGQAFAYFYLDRERAEYCTFDIDKFLNCSAVKGCKAFIPCAAGYPFNQSRIISMDAFCKTAGHKRIAVTDALLMQNGADGIVIDKFLQSVLDGKKTFFHDKY